MGNADRNYQLLKEISIEQKTWRIRVRVINIWNAYNTKKANRLMSMDMLLLDEEDQTIHTIIQANRVQQFSGLLSEGQLYEISYFDVRKTKQTFRVSDHDYQIHFLKNTTVTRLEENDVKIKQHKFKFADYNLLTEIAENHTHTPDIIGQAVRISDLTATGDKKIPKRDIEILFPGENTAWLTLWDNHAMKLQEKVGHLQGTAPIIIATAINPKIFQGKLTLSATSATKIYFNPDFEETKKFIASSNLKQRNLQLGVYSETASTLDVPAKITEISTILEFIKSEQPQDAEFSVLAEIQDIIDENGWSYVGCSSCFKKIAQDAETIQCFNCQKPDSIAILMYRLELDIKDKSGSCKCIMFDRQASKHLNISATELAELNTNEEVLTQSSQLFEKTEDVPTKAKYIIGKSLILKLNVTPYNFVPDRARFTVMSFSEHKGDEQQEDLDSEELKPYPIFNKEDKKGKRKQVIDESSDDGNNGKKRLEA